jgi:N-acetylmuramic acid 6-phosphate etherase
VVCNAGSAVAAEAEYPVEAVVGPEFVTGSTRMKAGTAQKLVLNMISTAVMIQLGRVRGNKMVDMQLSNEKLFERGVRMLIDLKALSREEAEDLLEKHGSVMNALKALGGAGA